MGLMEAVITSNKQILLSDWAPSDGVEENINAGREVVCVKYWHNKDDTCVRVWDKYETSDEKNATIIHIYYWLVVFIYIDLKIVDPTNWKAIGDNHCRWLGCMEQWSILSDILSMN